MAALSDYLENAILDHILRATAFTAPLTTYVGLLTAAPTDAGGGTEVTGNAYARVAVTSGLTAWNNTQGNTTGASTGTDGTIENAAVVTFPTPTPAGWGTVTHFAVYDAATAGNLLFYAALTASKVINAGDAVSFAAGALSLQLDN
jgi:hypothetical protein